MELMESVVLEIDSLFEKSLISMYLILNRYENYIFSLLPPSSHPFNSPHAPPKDAP